MSTIIMGQCWPLQMPPSPKAVMISLADQANDHGECWPAVGTIAKRTCLNGRTVQRCLRWLQERGALEVRESARQYGRARVNVYIITPGGYSAPVEANAAPADDAAQAPPEPMPEQPPRGLKTAATPRQCVTPAMCHPGNVSPTPRHHATQTVMEPIPIPPIPPKGADSPPGSDAEPRVDAPSPPRRVRQKREVLSLTDWLAQCRERGETPIPPDDPVFAYADRVGLPHDFVALAWGKFKAKRSAGGKGQADWRATFRNCVADNWFRLWYCGDGGRMALTSTGQLEQRNQDALAAQQGAAGPGAAEHRPAARRAA